VFAGFDAPEEPLAAPGKGPSPVVKPPPVAQPQEQSQVQPAQQPAAAAAAAPAEPAVPTDAEAAPGAAEVISAIESHVEKIAPQIEAAFKLSEADVSALESDAAAFVPKLLSRTYLQAVTTSLKYIQALVPDMINRQINTLAQQMTAEREFYETYPQLSQQHAADIIAFARAFRQANPRIERKALIQQVGLAVLAKNGIALNGGGSARSGGRRPAAPFAPAAQGRTVVQSAPVDENPFEGLGRDYDDET
jgi:hypothetical protein